MKSPRARSFKKFLEDLEQDFPPRKRPIKVVQCVTPYDSDRDDKRRKRTHGYCQELTHHTKIAIYKRDLLHIRKDTLMHEWAHALRMEKGDYKHSDQWGALYARIYRVMVDE